MRTTLTLDDDVSRELQELRRSNGQRMKTLVNEALRAGLLALKEQPSRQEAPYRTVAVDLGRPRLPNLDNVAEVLAHLEGDLHR